MRLYEHTCSGVCASVPASQQQQHGPEEPGGSQTRNLCRAERAAYHGDLSRFTRWLCPRGHPGPTVRHPPEARSGFQVPWRDVSDQLRGSRGGVWGRALCPHLHPPPRGFFLPLKALAPGQENPQAGPVPLWESGRSPETRVCAMPAPCAGSGASGAQGKGKGPPVLPRPTCTLLGTQQSRVERVPGHKVPARDSWLDSVKRNS